MAACEQLCGPRCFCPSIATSNSLAVRSLFVRRRVVNILSAASLLVAVIVSALWARSYVVQDYVTVMWPTKGGGVHALIHSCAGSFTVLYLPTSLHMTTPSMTRHAEPDPYPSAGSYLAELWYFDVARIALGQSSGMFTVPQWPLVTVAAAWPIARLVRCRRRCRTDAVPAFPIQPAGEAASR